MKKKIWIIGLIACLGVGIGSMFYVYASNKAIETQQAQARQIEALEVQTEARLEAVLAQRDMETLLRNNGLYEDEVRKNMTKYLQTVALYQMPQEHIDMLMDRVEQGKDLDKLLDIYCTLFMTNRDYSLMDIMYDRGKASNFKRGTWIEEALNKATNYAGGVLDEMEIQAYLDGGLTLSEIQLANALCFKGVKTIQQILDEKLAGSSWFTIISSIYPESNLDSGKFGDEEGTLIFEHIKTGMLNQESPNLSYAEDTAENNKLSVLSQDKLAAKADAAMAVTTEEGLAFVLDDSMLAYAKEKLPSMSEEEIRENIEEKGYLIREIERGLAIAAEEGITLDQAIRFDLGEEEVRK